MQTPATEVQVSLVRGPDLEGSAVDREEIASWMLDAGQPFLGWLLGSGAEETVRDWTVRDSSEFALRHTTLLLDRRHCVGGITALSGVELRRARVGDMQALLKASIDRDALANRLRVSRNWFIPVAADDFYISKVGVGLPYRGIGLGRVLVQSALDRAVAGGHRALRLDVATSNAAAIRLYRSLGFEAVGERYLEELATAYVAMRMEVPRL